MVFNNILWKIGASDGLRRTYISPVICLARTLKLLESGGYQCLAGNDFHLSVAHTMFSVVAYRKLWEESGRTFKLLNFTGPECLIKIIETFYKFKIFLKCINSVFVCDIPAGVP